MELIAVAVAVVGAAATFAWWDIAKRKVGAGLSLVEVSTRVQALDARVSKLEEHDLSNRNQIAGLKSFASARRR